MFGHKQYSLPIKIFLIIIIANVGPLLLLVLYQFIHFHKILFGRGDVLAMIYFGSILLTLSCAGFIASEIITPFKAFMSSIKSCRFKRNIPALTQITRIKEFNLLFVEYEKLIGEIAQREAELVEKARLATIGSAATMMAHDVRKPLAAVQMFLQALPGIKDDLRLTAEITHDIEKNIVHTNKMLNDVLEFSREEPQFEPQNHSVQNLVKTALSKVFYVNHGVKVNFFYDFNHQNVNVYVDDLRIVRVLINLITNSLEAMLPDGNGEVRGNILFKTELLDRDNQHFVKLMIIDDGCGISPEIMQKIYNPFFSYGKKNGNGLGLTICKNIMTTCGGEITVKNREDKPGVEVDLLFIRGSETYEEKTDLSSISNSQQLDLKRKKYALRAEMISI